MSQHRKAGERRASGSGHCDSDLGVWPSGRDEGSDFTMPDPNSTFGCPVRTRLTHWEDQAILCGAAVLRDRKVYVLYRAEDSK